MVCLFFRLSRSSFTVDSSFFAFIVLRDDPFFLIHFVSLLVMLITFSSSNVFFLMIDRGTGFSGSTKISLRSFALDDFLLSGV